MYICICNPFTDTDVEAYLDTLQTSARVSAVYHACSGGVSMNCGNCSCALKGMVDDHNSRLAVTKLSTSLDQIIRKEKQAA